MTGAETAMIVIAIVISLIVALSTYLVRRYLVLGNHQSDRGWDTFILFFFVAIVGSVLARVVPLPGY